MIKYDEYKVSKLGLIPSSWNVGKISYYSKVKTGGTPNRNNRSYWVNGTINWMSSGEINKEFIYEVNEQITSEGMLNSNATLLPINTVMIALNGQGKTKGTVGVLKVETTCNQSLAGFICEEGKLHPYYLFYFLKSKYKELRGMVGDESREGLSLSLLKSIEILIPTYHEQEEIGGYLFTKCGLVDDAVKKKLQLITLLKEERAALINHAVTKGIDDTVDVRPSSVEWLGEIPSHWEVKKLKYVAEIFRGKFTHRPRNDERLYNGIYPFIQTGDVARAGKYVTEYTQTLNEKGFEVTTQFPQGTLLMTIAANIGEVAILGFDACFPDSVIGFYPSTIDKEFLYYKLISLKQVFLSTSVVNTQMNLNVERVSGVFITYPSVEEQRAIVNHIEHESKRISEAIAKIEKEIELLIEYKTSLIHEVVSGKVRVDSLVKQPLEATV